MFTKIRGTFLGGPRNKDHCILGVYIGVPLFWETRAGSPPTLNPIGSFRGFSPTPWAPSMGP